jgi:short-subunit dehydrogenase
MTHVVVTGASSGIGEALAQEYLRRGASLTLVARRKELLEKLVAGASNKTHLVQADLSDVARSTEWIAGAEAALGPIDVLINNAGVQIVAPMTHTTWADAERLLALDLHTPLKLTSAIVPGMIARKSGCIVDVASMAALAPTPGMYFYNAAKGGLAAASEGLRGELRGTGVHVVTVYPGPVKSPMEEAGRAAYADSAALRYVPTGKPDRLAVLIANAVDQKKARVIYPGSYAISRHFPNLTRFITDRFTPPLKALT